LAFKKFNNSQGPTKYLMGLKNVKSIKAGVYIRVGLKRSFRYFINYFMNLFYEIRFQKLQNFTEIRKNYFQVIFTEKLLKLFRCSFK
jgi:hypothetical protein